MAKIKRKFKNLILLVLLLVVWVGVGLLSKIVPDKVTASFIKEAQGYCCPCAAPVPEACDCGEGSAPEGGCASASCCGGCDCDCDCCA